MASEALALRASAGVPSGARYHRTKFGPVLRTLSGRSLRDKTNLAACASRGRGGYAPPLRVPKGPPVLAGQDHSSEGVQAQVWWVLRSKLAGRARLLRSTTGDPQSTPERATLFGIGGDRREPRTNLVIF